MEPKTIPTWASGCVNKYGFDAIRVMCDLIEAGLKNGEVSANNISTANRETFAEPKIIGAIMKIAMSNCGFAQKTVESTGRTYFLMIKSTKKKTHGRMITVWELKHHHMAMMAKAELMAALPIVGFTDDDSQGDLF